MDILSSALSTFLTTIMPSPPPTPETGPPANSPDPLRTIIKIALLLRTRLPADIVPLILDHAKLWIPLTSAHSLNPDIDKISQAQSPKLQVALTIPAHIPHDSIRRIRFTTISRDQGWSDFTRDHGTYTGSWTWFEAGVRGLLPLPPSDSSNLDADADVEGLVDTGLAALTDVRCTHRNALDPEHKSLCQPQVRLYKYGSREIVRNVHAGRDFAEHTVEWSVDDPDVAVRQTVRELGKGCRIEVAAYAQYPAWVNYVRSVQIEVEGLAIRKL